MIDDGHYEDRHYKQLKWACIIGVTLFLVWLGYNAWELFQQLLIMK